MSNSSIEVKKTILQERHSRKLEQVKAIEDDIDLTIDSSQKTILKEKAENLWAEIKKVEDELSLLEGSSSNNQTESKTTPDIEQGSYQTPPQHFDLNDPLSRDGQLSSALANLEALPLYSIVSRPNLRNKVMQFIIEERSPAVLIHGLPGFGKTVLLCELIRELNKDFPQIFAVKFSGPLSLEPSYFLEELNEYLNKIGKGLDKELIKSQSLQRSLHSLLPKLSELQLLVILDAVDQAPAELLQPLLQSLTASNQIQVILTARSRIIEWSNARIIAVPPLSTDESLDFVSHYIKLFEINYEHQALLDSLPTNIKENPQALSMFLANLKDIPLELLIMEGFEETEYIPSELVKNIMSSLNKNALSCLATLALFNNLEFVKSLKLLELSTPKGFVKSIKLLLIKSLVNRQDEIYRVPLIVSEFLADLFPQIIDEAVSDLCSHLKITIKDINSNSTSAQLDDVIRVIARIIHGLYQLKYYRWVTKLATDDFLEFLNLRGIWKEYWLILRATFDSARQISDNQIFIRIGFRIARKSFQVRDINIGRQALTDVERVINIAGDARDNAELLSHKALFTELDGDNEKAIKELLQSLKIRKQLGDTEGIVIVEKLIGNLYLQQKEYTNARQRYEAALSAINEIKSHSKELVEVETSLALCDLADGSLQKAESLLLSAIKNCKDIGYMAGLPRAYYNLCLVLDAQGRATEALAYANLILTQLPGTSQTIIAGATILTWRLNNLNQEE